MRRRLSVDAWVAVACTVLAAAISVPAGSLVSNVERARHGAALDRAAFEELRDDEAVVGRYVETLRTMLQRYQDSGNGLHFVAFRQLPHASVDAAMVDEDAMASWPSVARGSLPAADDAIEELGAEFANANAMEEGASFQTLGNLFARIYTVSDQSAPSLHAGLEAAGRSALLAQARSDNADMILDATVGALFVGCVLGLYLVFRTPRAPDDGAPSPE